MANNLIFIDGKKFMWDGIDYPDGEKTLEAMKKYKADGFEVELREEEGKNCLYTRRVVGHVVVPNA